MNPHNPQAILTNSCDAAALAAKLPAPVDPRVVAAHSKLRALKEDVRMHRLSLSQRATKP